MNIHVSNLNLNLTESDLQRMFAPFGEVKLIELVRDKLNNRSRGRAYINMPVEVEGKNAVQSLNGQEIKGKLITVSEVSYDPSFSTFLNKQNPD